MYDCFKFFFHLELTMVCFPGFFYCTGDDDTATEQVEIVIDIFIGNKIQYCSCVLQQTVYY